MRGCRACRFGALSKKEVLPVADQWEFDGMVPREIFRNLGALGFFGVRYPLEYGGGGLGPMSSVVFGEELTRSSYGGNRAFRHTGQVNVIKKLY